MNLLRALQGLLPHSGPQVTMAMKPKKERFHVGVLNQDLKGGNEQREKVEEEKEGATANRTPQFYKPETKYRGGRRGACKEESEKFTKTHRFGVQLMSVLRQNLLHAGLVCVCDEPKPPGRNYRGKKKEAGLGMKKIGLKSSPPPLLGEAKGVQSVDGAATTPPPYLDRLVTGSRITMHSFTSPNLQKYSFKPSAKGEMWLGHQT